MASEDARDSGRAAAPDPEAIPNPGFRSAVLPFLPYAVLSAVHVVALLLEHPAAAPTKLLLMPALALAAVWSGASLGLWRSRLRPRPRGPILLLILAVGFSWLGDGAATFFPGLPELPMMLLCFGLAHVGYLWLLWRTPGVAVRRFRPWALVYAAWWIALLSVLGPHTGGLLIPVALYGVLLAGTAAMSSRCGAVIAAGGAWFLVSDSILAFRLFLPDVMPQWTSGAVMLTYCLGQGLIAFGVLRALRRRRTAAEVRAPAAPAAA